MTFTSKTPPRKEQTTGGFENAMAKLKSLPAMVDLIVAAVLAAYAGFAILIDHARFVGLVCILLAIVFVGLGFSMVMKDMRRVKVLERLKSVDQLRDMDRYEALATVTAIYELSGYTVQPADESDRKQADIDLIAAKSKKERILVRCRDWEKNSVELTTVKNIKAATTGLNATSAAIYTTGTFPTDCRDFASTKNVELIDAHGTLARIAEIVASAPDSTPTPAANPLLSHSETGEIHPMDVRRTATTEAAKPQRIIFVDAEAVRTGGDLVTQVLERHPGFSLVASSHGEGDEEHLRTAITGATIIGSTPDMTGMPGKTRFLEITQFLETTAAPTAIWAAIDTNPQLFPEATIELVLVTSERGFTHGAAERLSETLRLGVQRIRLADSTNPSINSGAGCVKRWATNA